MPDRRGTPGLCVALLAARLVLVGGAGQEECIESGNRTSLIAVTVYNSGGPTSAWTTDNQNPLPNGQHSSTRSMVNGDRADDEPPFRPGKSHGT